MYEFKNLFYFTMINSIGGVETFYWYLVQKYKDRDICIVYKSGDEEQIKRLRQYVRVIKFNGQHFKCEKAFFNYTIDIIDYVEAKEYIQLVHGDYTKFRITPYLHPKMNKFLGVSKLVCDTWEQVTGQKAEVAYNPIVIRKPEKILHLISATRLTAEKGSNRIIALANALDNAGVKYDWTIYTDSRTPLPCPNIYFRTPRLDITDFIAEADYLVQLSDTEGYCFSVVEALSLGTPVIVTDCPVFKEIGVVNGKNGFVLDFDMKKIPIAEIAKGLPKVVYKPIEDTWDKILAKGESQYQKDMNKKVQIVAVKEYFDLVINKKMNIGDVAVVSKARADYIIDSGYARLGGDKSGNTGQNQEKGRAGSGADSSDS